MEISDLENLEISNLRASSAAGWRWEVNRAEAPECKPYGFICDNCGSFNDLTTHPHQAASIRFSSQSEPVSILEGDHLIITCDGGTVLRVYPPPVSGKVDVYYYIGRDGSTYSDRWLCQLAKRVPTPTGTPTPSATVTPTATAAPSVTPTVSVRPTETVTPAPTTTPSPSVKPIPTSTVSPTVTSTPLNPSIRLVKTVNGAPPGTADISRLDSDAACYYLVTNTGDTHLSDIEVRDDSGRPEDHSAEVLIGVVSGPLAPGQSAGLQYDFPWVAVRFGRAVAVGVPSNDKGTPHSGLSPVSAEDTAISYTCIVTGGSDYDGTGRNNIATWTRGKGKWFIQKYPINNRDVYYFGRSGDLPVPGDYDGDGLTDVAVFRPETGLWAVRGVTRFYFGQSSDLPVPAAYNGLGSVEAGIFRRSTGLWAIRGLTRFYFGGILDLPVPGVYESYDRTRAAIFRPSSGLWVVRGLTRRYFGIEGDYPVSADYTGDGVKEFGIFRDSSGLWAVSGVTRTYFGRRFDFPQPADYAGDGTAGIIIYRPANGLWAVKGMTRMYWGGPNAVPLTR